MSAKSMIWLTFFQDLQEKVSRGRLSMNFDTSFERFDVKKIINLIFCQRSFTWKLQLWNR